MTDPARKQKRRTIPRLGNRPFVSLRVRFAVVLITTALITILAAILLIPIAVNVVTKVYMQPKNINDRLDNYASDFAEYVAEEHVRADDSAAIVKWTRRRRNVHLVIFEGGEARFGIMDGEILEGSTPPVIDALFSDILGEDEQPTEQFGNTYAVTFADGVAPVAVVDYSQPSVSGAALIIGIIIAIALFFVVMLLYYHRQIKAIAVLSVEVENISGGALHADIRVDRNDEIGRLAHDVDVMRTTILETMEERRRAWDANSELITSMSHDIRTPLTALLGYMELLGSDTSNMTPEQEAYIRVCATKAEQIKGLSDKLFLYFWAFNRAEAPVATEILEAGLLLEQILGEALIWPESEGIVVKASVDALPNEMKVTVNVDCLRRVIDNVFDNIRKYADRASPVMLAITAESGAVRITMENKIGAKRETTSSTRVGLKTCHNMMSLMGGNFSAEQHDGLFQTVIILPIAPPAS